MLRMNSVRKKRTDKTVVKEHIVLAAAKAFAQKGVKTVRIALINVESNYSFLDSCVNSIGTSIGYTMAILLFSCIRERLDEKALPKCLQNLPIALITASCMSISMMGMSGIH